MSFTNYNTDSAKPELLRHCHSYNIAAPALVPSSDSAATVVTDLRGGEGIEAPRLGPAAWAGAEPRLEALRASLADERLSARAAPVHGSIDEMAMAAAFDAVFYRTMYRRMMPVGVSELAHFAEIGWRQGLDPASWFSVDDYLATNPDVAASGLNPFWHYINSGRSEGRLPRSPAKSFRVGVVQGAMDADERTAGYIVAADPRRLSRPALRDRLRPVCQNLVLSVSHDRYIDVRGGVQLFIATEQASYAKAGTAYLQISPVRPMLRLADPSGGKALLHLVLDGVAIGAASYADLTWALKQNAPASASQRRFVVHCLLGHDTLALAVLQDALAGQENLFWLHDYSSLCPGFNLLRNDVAFCGAPGVNSLTCRVCVHGARRPSHMAAIEALFSAVPFQVIAPSQAALDTWRRGWPGPPVNARVQEHLRVCLGPTLPAARPRPLPGTLANPVRVAFVGFRANHKGWPLWQALARQSAELGAYRFIHFGSAEAFDPTAHGEVMPAATTAADPAAMTRALASQSIDLVVMLSLWPETFSFTTYEAMAAGADVVCLRSSGNVADAVRRYQRGVVVADEATLLDFFTSLQAVDYVRRCQSVPARAMTLLHDGANATLDHTAPRAGALGTGAA